MLTVVLIALGVILLAMFFYIDMVVLEKPTLHGKYDLYCYLAFASAIAAVYCFACAFCIHYPEEGIAIITTITGVLIGVAIAELVKKMR